jgi:ABC-2 type transport system permease protein
VVGVFASLKWRLVTSRLRATKGATRAWLIVLAVVLAIVVGFLAFGVGTLRLVPEFATPILISLFALQLVGWMLTPLLAFGVDETVDPARFALLPIRPQTLQVGLLTTSVIGFFPLANFVVLIGAGMPSVLAEISFLTHKQEGQLLKTSTYRQQIAEALLDAVQVYQRSLKSRNAIATREQ